MSEKNPARFTAAIGALKAVETHDAGTAAEIVAIIKQIEKVQFAPREVITVGAWMEMGKPVFVSAHPEYLKTLEDYANAPIGTKVESRLSPHDFEKVNWETWSTYSALLFTNEEMSGRPRRVTRWGEDG